jgi:hypothetical protein
MYSVLISNCVWMDYIDSWIHVTGRGKEFIAEQECSSWFHSVEGLLNLSLIDSWILKTPESWIVLSSSNVDILVKSVFIMIACDTKLLWTSAALQSCMHRQTHYAGWNLRFQSRYVIYCHCEQYGQSPDPSTLVRGVASEIWVRQYFFPIAVHTALLNFTESCGRHPPPS